MPRIAADQSADSEPLALDAAQSAIRAEGIVNAQLDAIAVSEIELGQVAVLVLL